MEMVLFIGVQATGKSEYLFRNDINFNEVSNWQKRGIGLYWEDYEKTGVNPVSGDVAKTIRAGSR